MSTQTADQMDTFDNGQVAELPKHDTADSVDLNSQVQNAGIDTFDNEEVILPDTMNEGNQEEVNAKEESEEPKKEVKRETDSLEDQTDETDEANDEESKEAKSEEDGDDSTSEEDQQSEEENTGTDESRKTIRLKDGDERFDIPEDATVPVKVKGRKEFVSLNELRENYSGKKVWSDEIEAAKGRQVELEREKEDFEASREETRNHFRKIGSMLHEAFENPEADPLAAMKYLVELGGRNVLDFEKTMMGHYGKLASQFSEMDETEQELYWTRRENELLRNNQATQSQQVEERRAQEQRNQQLAQVREKYGVSEEEYLATEQELEQLGYDLEQVTPEQVSHYAALKPMVEQAEQLTKQFEEDLSTDELEQLISGTADTMYKFPDLDPEEALKISAKRLGYQIFREQELVEQLVEKKKKPESRLTNRTPAKSAVRYEDDGHIESFDDFDELIYNRR